MKLTLASLAVALAAALVPGPAASHPGGWWWTANRADFRLLADDSVPSRFLQIRRGPNGPYIAVSFDSVEGADCVGIGPRLRAMYRHFNCEIKLVEYEHYYDSGYVGPWRQSFVRILHVTGPRSFVLSKP